MTDAERISQLEQEVGLLKTQMHRLQEQLVNVAKAVEAIVETDTDENNSEASTTG